MAKTYRIRNTANYAVEIPILEEVRRPQRRKTIAFDPDLNRDVVVYEDIEEVFQKARRTIRIEPTISDHPAITEVGAAEMRILQDDPIFQHMSTQPDYELQEDGEYVNKGGSGILLVLQD